MNELVVFDEVTATLAGYKAENEKFVFDYADPEGEKQARSHIAKLRKVKTRISDIHKAAKADALVFGRKLDGKKRELIGEVEGMIAVHKDPLDAIEAEKQAVIDAEKALLEEAEAKRLADLEAREAAVIEKEAKQAREKAEAEEKIAREVAEAERVEREKRIAEEAAEKARIQAEQKAKAEAEAKELASIRAKEAVEAKEKKRIANGKHREKIEGEIQLTLKEMGYDDYTIARFISALKENAIPHVSINY